MDVEREGLIMFKPPHLGTHGGEKVGERGRDVDQSNAGPRKRERERVTVPLQRGYSSM
jgi:hypothetical protein